MEVNGGASIGSTFLFQLFIFATRLSNALLLPCRRNFVRSRPTVACIPTKLELGVDPLNYKDARRVDQGFVDISATALNAAISGSILAEPEAS